MKCAPQARGMSVTLQKKPEKWGTLLASSERTDMLQGKLREKSRSEIRALTRSLFACAPSWNNGRRKLFSNLSKHR